MIDVGDMVVWKDSEDKQLEGVVRMLGEQFNVVLTKQYGYIMVRKELLRKLNLKKN